MVAGVGVVERVPESEAEVVTLAGDAEDAAAVAVVSCFVDASWDVLRADGALAQVQAAQGRSTGKDDPAIRWVEGDQLVLGGSEEAVSCWGPLGEIGVGDNVEFVIKPYKSSTLSLEAVDLIPQGKRTPATQVVLTAGCD